MLTFFFNVTEVGIEPEIQLLSSVKDEFIFISGDNTELNLLFPRSNDIQS